MIIKPGHDLMYPVSVWGSEQAAKLARDRQARELRAQGEHVKCSRVDFANLARDAVYLIERLDNRGMFGNPCHVVKPEG